MDNAQKLTLRTHIQANTTSLAFGGGTATIANTFAGALDGGDAKIIADWYNLLVSPAFYAWRSAVSEDEFVSATGIDVANGNAATNWSWTGTGFITRSQGERDCWSRIFRGGSCNPSLANVRTAFSDIISGATAPAPANRNHMLVIAKRKISNFEKVFGTGTGTFASPVVMGLEGIVTGDEISDIKGLPA